MIKYTKIIKRLTYNVTMSQQYAVFRIYFVRDPLRGTNTTQVANVSIYLL